MVKHKNIAFNTDTDNVEMSQDDQPHPVRIIDLLSSWSGKILFYALLRCDKKLSPAISH